MNRITDWSDQGVLPLQDWREGIELGRKMTTAGARISRMTESGDPSELPVEIAAENNRGTIGDVHPWLFLQTADRQKRPMGAWVMGHAAITGDLQTGGSVDALPIRGWAWQADQRFVPSLQLDPTGLSRRVKGQIGTVWPSMRDDGPSSLWVHGDSRLLCPSVSGPYESGTLVCDLQPTYEICMDNSGVPGVYGRHARIQSMMRVIAFEPGSTGGVVSSAGNGVAWNLQQSRDGMLGLGMCWAKVSSGRFVASGPITGPRTSSPAQNQSYTGGVIGENEHQPEYGTGGNDLGKMPHEYGRFEPAPATSSAVILMAHEGGGGPIHGGCVGDKHNLGADRDGNPINAAHIATGALFYDNPTRDGPLLFEGAYPNPGPLPLTSPVHLTFDPDRQHQFPGGAKPGVWRWYAEVPYLTPNDPPITPNQGRPVTPGGGGGRGPTTPGGPGGPGGPTPPPIPPGPTTPGVPAPGGGRAPTGPITPNPGGIRFPGYPSTGPAGRTPGGPRGPGAPPPGRVPQTPTTPGSVETNPFEGLAVDPVDPEAGKYPLERKPATRWNEATGQWEPRVVDFDGRAKWLDQSGNILDVEPVPTPRIGELRRDESPRFVIHHPLAESFSGIHFRPQLYGNQDLDLERGQFASREMLARDERLRPHVLGLRSWGAHDNGWWKYTENPGESRLRGGVASGGLILTPPSVEMEDYLAPRDESRTLDEIENPTEEVTFALAPGVRMAFGVPVADGGMAAGAVLIRQDQDQTGLTGAGDAAGKLGLLVEQLDDTRTAHRLLDAGIDTATGEVTVRIGGEAGLVLPSGLDADRPSSPESGHVRSNGESTTEELEHFDDAGGTGWRKIVSVPATGSAGDIAYHDGTEWQLLAAGTTGQVLKIGAGGLPEWASP